MSPSDFDIISQSLAIEEENTIGEKIYDKNNKWVATREKGAFGADVIRDRDGKIINYLDKDFLGNPVIRDRDGKVQGYRDRTDFLGNRVVQDRDGKVAAYVRSKGDGHTGYYDRDGKYMGAADRKPAGGGLFGSPQQSSHDSHDPYRYEMPAYDYPDFAGYAGPVPRTPRYRSPQEILLEKRTSTLFFLSVLAYLLPLLYLLASFFSHSLPTSLGLMIFLLLGGSFLSQLLARSADSSPSFVGHIFLWLIYALIYLLQLSQRFPDLTYSLSRRAAYWYMLGGTGALLIAMLAGRIIGRFAYKRLKEKTLSQGSSQKRKK